MKTVSQILTDASKLFDERSEVYSAEDRQGYEIYGPLMQALFSDKLNPKNAADHARLGILTQILSKIVRYSLNFSKGGHEDSARDLVVYSAMLFQMTDNEGAEK